MKSRKQSCYKENAPPSDKNIIPDSFPSQSFARKPSPNVGTRLKSPFPPRPNLHNPLKKKLTSDALHDSDVSGSFITAVKLNVCCFDFSFRPIYLLVGAPLVENCFAGVNNSIFAYGQEQKEHADEELMYQCSCSFLEIYNEQITDLLNPSERNLHIKECPKSGFMFKI
ncbi:kinesin-like protein KIN-12B [Tanacetum coccineum]